MDRRQAARPADWQVGLGQYGFLPRVAVMAASGLRGEQFWVCGRGNLRGRGRQSWLPP
jgi:hypothetical protein